MKILFDNAIDSSKYTASFPQADGAEILSIDYETNTYRFKLTLDDVISNDVFGVTSEEASEINAAADIMSEILSK